VELAEQCTYCGICREACRSGLIDVALGRLPSVRFDNGGCSFCGACANACPEDLFDRDRPAWSLIARVEGPCLTLPVATCGLCETVCDPAAIRLTVTGGGATLAAIDADRCNGCGACVSVCPTNAIAMDATV